MRKLLPIILLSATTLSCATGSAGARQIPAASACLPTAIPRILACAQAKDYACTVVALAMLVACWGAHQGDNNTPPSVHDGGKDGINQSLSVLVPDNLEHTHNVCPVY